MQRSLLTRILCLFAILCLLSPVATAGATGGLGEIFERGGSTPPPVETPAPGPAPLVLRPLFDEGVRKITYSTYGPPADCVLIDGNLICRGYMEPLQRYCLINKPHGGTPEALTDSLPPEIIPAVDAYLYRGDEALGEPAWLIRKPGEAPQRLDLSAYDTVFYANAEFIWYYTPVGEEIAIRQLSRQDNQKEGLMRATGHVAAVLGDGGVLTVDFNKNCMQKVKDGVIETLYAPEEQIVLVYTLGRNVWVEVGHAFGLFAEGGPSWWLPGHIVSATGAIDQYVFLIETPGADEYDVIMCNDQYGAYARVGRVPASEYAFVELDNDLTITVWSPIQSLLFDVPPPEEWIPYGYDNVKAALADLVNNDQ